MRMTLAHNPNTFATPQPAIATIESDKWTVETLTRFAAEHNAEPASETRLAWIAEHLPARAQLSTTQMVQLITVRRVAYDGTVTLPHGRYHRLSRGKGWARLGRGDNVQWGANTGKTWRVTSPGEWTVQSSDGFDRDETTTWEVYALDFHSDTGAHRWLIAD